MNESSLNEYTDMSGKSDILISAVSKLYYAFYDVDLEKDCFIKYHASKSISDFTDRYTSADKCLQDLTAAMFEPDYQEVTARFFETSGWPDLLKEKDNVYLYSKGTLTGWVRINLIAASRDEKGVPSNVIVAVQSVNEKMAMEISREEQREMQLRENLNVIRSIAGMYHSLYYIDLTDGTFIEQGQSASNVRKVIGKSGNAAEAMENMCRHLVDPAYAEEMRIFTDISTLPERLQGNKWINREYIGASGR